MYLRRGRAESSGRNSCRTRRAPSRSPGPYRQGLPYMILLANCPGRCSGLSPTMRRLQLFANQSHMPPTALKTISITWPFAVWRIDMVGPLKGGTHKQKYLLVMVDKFTKLIEAKPVKTAESGPVIDFISGVVHRYGVPHSIIPDKAQTSRPTRLNSGAKIWASSSTTLQSITPKLTVKSNEQMV